MNGTCSISAARRRNVLASSVYCFEAAPADVLHTTNAPTAAPRTSASTTWPGTNDSLASLHGSPFISMPPNTGMYCETGNPERNNGWDFGAGGAAKWRSPLGYECAYDDANGNLLPDTNGNYTYNYADPPKTIQHALVDFLAHYFYEAHSPGGGNDVYEPNVTTVPECE